MCFVFFSYFKSASIQNPNSLSEVNSTIISIVWTGGRTVTFYIKSIFISLHFLVFSSICSSSVKDKMLCILVYMFPIWFPDKCCHKSRISESVVLSMNMVVSSFFTPIPPRAANERLLIIIAKVTGLGLLPWFACRSKRLTTQSMVLKIQYWHYFLEAYCSQSCSHFSKVEEHDTNNISRRVQS